MPDGLPYEFEDAILDASVISSAGSRTGKVFDLSITECPRNEPHFFRDDDCDIFVSKFVCDARRRTTTYLVSYPCSGNTWTRTVLQGVLQIHSGSVFNDKSLQAIGLLGEGVTDPRRVLPIKTHYPVVGKHKPYARNLVIVRAPLHATLSYTILQNTAGHADELSLSELTVKFDAGMADHLSRWRTAAETWKNCAPSRPIGDCHVVRFEDIVADTRAAYLREILPYLGVNSSHPDVIRRLDCAIDRANSAYGTSRRQHSYVFEFTEQHKKLAREIVGASLLDHFGYNLS